ncbi:hypothetical protein C8Q70DRAFT_990385 [Cubamyces menziesii]|nr:hypothetical protein C8Q70DRAFT_990385 [Cubamyces menziesii]
MLETVVSEKPVLNRQQQQQQQQQQSQQPLQPTAQPAAQPAINPGRFRGMLQRASTLNGRHATAPAPAAAPASAVPNVEKALPPAVVSASPSPGLDVKMPIVDPMGDNAPPPAPATPAIVTEKPLVAEPEETGGDAVVEIQPEEVEAVPPPAPPPKEPAPLTVASDDKSQPNEDAEPATATEPHPLAENGSS